MDSYPIIQPKEIDDGANTSYWDTVRRKGHNNPEQDLMLTVLKDALLNYRKNLRNPRKSVNADRVWFFGVESDRLFSFESVCTVLGLNSQRIRKRLLDWESEARAGRTADSK
jgi:hypothetical protein